MKNLLSLVGVALLAFSLQGCALSPSAMERMHQLELEQVREQTRAELAETNEEQIGHLERVEELEHQKDLVRMEDFGSSAGYLWEILISLALGAGGFGAIRAAGPSRSAQTVSNHEGRLQALERMATAPAVPTAPAQEQAA